MEYLPKISAGMIERCKDSVEANLLRLIRSIQIKDQVIESLKEIDRIRIKQLKNLEGGLRNAKKQRKDNG